MFLPSGPPRGQAQRGRHLVPPLQLYHASALAHFATCLLPDNRRLPMFALIPSPQALPTSSLTQMAEWVMNEFGTEGSAYFIDTAGVHLDAFTEAVARAQCEGTPVCILA